MKKLSFAVIGCGSLAMNSHILTLAASEKAILHTCCDISEEALKVCREEHGALHTTTDYLEAINDPEVDAIVIATTEKFRLVLIEAAAKVGKPVYCEKPLAKTLEEMYEIQKVVNESGIPFCVGHNRRNSQAMIDAHKIFRAHMESPKPCEWRWKREGADLAPVEGDGVAGMSVRINDDWYSWKNWVFDPDQAPEGAMLFEMTHFTDLCNWFMASKPVQVASISKSMFNHGVVITYENGEMATIFMTTNGTFGYPKELYEMFGNGGAVAVNHMVEVRTAGIADAPALTTYPYAGDPHPEVGTEGGFSGWMQKSRACQKDAIETGDTSKAIKTYPDKGHTAALENFIDEINGVGPQVCGVDDAVLATRVSFAALKAAKEERTVSLDEI